jgi:NAD(P)-dependent dehydrogenase (short-subunit alcohol dehydrogenase family)
VSGDNSKKVLIVTGTTSGMGRTIALDAATAGYTVVATGRDQERMKRLEQDAAGHGVELDIRFLEITDHEAVYALVDEVVRKYGHLDAVVSQAGGIFALGTAEQITMGAYRFVMETNFLRQPRGDQGRAAAPARERRPPGRHHQRERPGGRTV